MVFANGFHLNEAKTESFLFTLKHDVDANSYKTLGIHLDTSLSWETHINNITSKLSSIVYLFRRLKFILPHEYVRGAYFAYFQSIIKYGLLLWGNSCHVHKIFLIQKRVIRVLTNSSVKEHCKPLFVKEKIMTIYSLYIFEAIMYGKDNFISFENRNQETTYNLRKINNFDMPKCRLTKTMSNFPVFALKVCNKFPRYIFQLDKKSIKRLASDWLIQKAWSWSLRGAWG